MAEKIKLALLDDITQAKENLWEIRNVLSNRNLLHNWDFRNPVNQRGLGEYTESGYMMDRWRKYAALGRIELINPGNNGYIAVTSLGEGSLNIAQILETEMARSLLGKTITASILFENGELYSTTGIVPIVPGNMAYTGDFQSGAGYITLALTAQYTLMLYIYLRAGRSANIRAVKLELGTVSTLANDAPMDYGAELAKCQRYQVAFPAGGRFRADVVASNVFAFTVPTPVTMRVNPILTGNITVCNLGGTPQPGFTFTYELKPNGIYISAEKAAHGLNDAHVSLGIGAILDANI